MYDNEQIVRASFDLNYVSEYLIQAQWAEFVELKKAIHEISERTGRQLSILDIGIGNGRVPRHLSAIHEIWNRIHAYVGTDNARACIRISNEMIAELGIGDKITAIHMDATELDKQGRKYDAVIATWFTAGNFFPDDFSFDGYTYSEEKCGLSVNPKFSKIFMSAYELLNNGGEIIIGSCYKDNEATRLKQEEAYRKMGMTVITGKQETFTATKEGFWSQRFSKEKIFAYLPFIPKENFRFIDLDTYDYAVQVRIRKL